MVPVPAQPFHAPVALCLPTLFPGGVEHIIVSLANALAAAGHPTHLVVLDRDGPLAASVSPEVDVCVLGPPLSWKIPRLARLFRTWGVVGVILAHGRWCLKPGLAALIAGVPYVPTVHSLTGPSYRWAQGSPLRERVFAALAHLVFGRAKALIAASESAARALEACLGLTPNSVHVAPQPVVSPRLEELAAQPAPHPWLSARDRPVVMTVCRLVPVKDLATLIHAFARLRATRAARLVIVGRGPEESALRQLCSAVGVADDVLFAGFDANPWRWMSRADVFAVSSVNEGLCCALIEALALGTPAVSTDCGGPRDVLESGRWGELVPPREPAQLAAAIERVLDGIHPPGAETQARMRQRYSVEAAVLAHLDILLGRS